MSNILKIEKKNQFLRSKILQMIKVLENRLHSSNKQQQQLHYIPETEGAANIKSAILLVTQVEVLMRTWLKITLSR